MRIADEEGKPFYRSKPKSTDDGPHLALRHQKLHEPVGLLDLPGRGHDAPELEKRWAMPCRLPRVPLPPTVDGPVL